jgi:hypothetical protein
VTPPAAFWIAAVVSASGTTAQQGAQIQSTATHAPTLDNMGLTLDHAHEVAGGDAAVRREMQIHRFRLPQLQQLVTH